MLLHSYKRAGKRMGGRNQQLKSSKRGDLAAANSTEIPKCMMYVFIIVWVFQFKLSYTGSMHAMKVWMALDSSCMYAIIVSFFSVNGCAVCVYLQYCCHGDICCTVCNCCLKVIMFLAACVNLLAESHWILVIHACLQSEFSFMWTIDCHVDTELEEINCFSLRRQTAEMYHWPHHGQVCLGLQMWLIRWHS